MPTAYRTDCAACRRPARSGLQSAERLSDLAAVGWNASATDGPMQACLFGLRPENKRHLRNLRRTRIFSYSEESIFWRQNAGQSHLHISGRYVIYCTYRNCHPLNILTWRCDKKRHHHRHQIKSVPVGDSDESCSSNLFFSVGALLRTVFEQLLTWYIPHLGTAFSDGFTALSFPGQFAPWSESANRTMANSLPGTFAPLSEMARELSFPGTFALKSIRFQEHSPPVTFVPR